MIDRLVLAQLYWKRGNTELDTIGIFVIGAGLLAVLIYAIVRNRTSLFGHAVVGFDKAAFRRAARDVGLDDGETRFLEEFARDANLADPGGAFSNPERIDSLFRVAYRRIDNLSTSEADAEDKKARLFVTRERLAQGAGRGEGVSSTRQLGKGMPLTFIAPGDESYPTVVLANEPAGIAIEAVMDAYGDPIRFKRGMKLTCYFYAKGHQGFQFTSRIEGWRKIDDRETIMIMHSDSVTALPSRRHSRKEGNVSCTFYRVRPGQAAAKAGAKPGAAGGVSRAVVETIAYPGTAIDISAGGAGIRSANALNEGEFVKVELQLGRGSQTAFGKVIRMNRLKTRGGVMHIQFVKVPQKTLNAIRSFVYGYTE
jgi:hypothetical protein